MQMQMQMEHETALGAYNRNGHGNQTTTQLTQVGQEPNLRWNAACQTIDRQPQSS